EERGRPPPAPTARRGRPVRASAAPRAPGGRRPATRTSAWRRGGGPPAGPGCEGCQALEPPLQLIPLQGAADALAEPDLRSVAQLLAGARDVERAALGEEVHAPPVNRRLDAQRHARRLAQCA